MIRLSVLRSLDTFVFLITGEFDGQFNESTAIAER